MTCLPAIWHNRPEKIAPGVRELIRANRDVRLLVEVETTLRLAAYQPGRIEFVPTDNVFIGLLLWE